MINVIGLVGHLLNSVFKENNSVGVLHLICTSDFLALLLYRNFSNLYILDIVFFTIKLFRWSKTITVNKGFVVAKKYFLASFLISPLWVAH